MSFHHYDGVKRESHDIASTHYYRPFSFPSPSPFPFLALLCLQPILFLLSSVNI